MSANNQQQTTTTMSKSIHKKPSGKEKRPKKVRARNFTNDEVLFAVASLFLLLRSVLLSYVLHNNYMLCNALLCNQSSAHFVLNHKLYNNYMILYHLHPLEVLDWQHCGIHISYHNQ